MTETLVVKTLGETRLKLLSRAIKRARVSGQQVECAPGLWTLATNMAGTTGRLASVEVTDAAFDETVERLERAGWRLS
jgi:hypothetical protein